MTVGFSVFISANETYLSPNQHYHISVYFCGVREGRGYVFAADVAGEIHCTVRMKKFRFIERDEMRVVDILEVECVASDKSHSVDSNIKHQILPSASVFHIKTDLRSAGKGRVPCRACGLLQKDL